MHPTWHVTSVWALFFWGASSPRALSLMFDGSSAAILNCSFLFGKKKKQDKVSLMSFFIISHVFYGSHSYSL
jgi:hypothetical protein